MSKNALSTFIFGSSLIRNCVEIRVITIDGEPWFVAKDVCEVLGYTNSRDAIATHAAGHQTRVMSKSNVANGDVNFPNRGLTIISEGGLYSLIFGSKMPAAEQFKSWVTDVVLPAIRKDGAYIMGEEKVATGEMSEDELRLAA